MWTTYYSNTNGVWADTTQDFFINGYKPDLNGSRNDNKPYKKERLGGYFHQVFGANLLTERIDILHSPQAFKDFSAKIREALKSGKSLGVSIIFSSNRNAHIVTIWGAEYNARGEVKALSTTDSDDRVSRMTGVNVKVRGNEIRRSNNTKDFNFGPRVYDLYTLDLGTKHWENYFKTQGGN